MGREVAKCNADPALCETFARQADAALPGGSDRYVLVIEEAAPNFYRMRIDAQTGGAVRKGDPMTLTVMDREVSPKMYDRMIASLIRAYRKQNDV